LLPACRALFPSDESGWRNGRMTVAAVARDEEKA